MKRYRKVMGLAIVLVALAVAINALAFNTANVTSQATFTISGSGAAALGIDTSGSSTTGFSVTGTSNSYATIAITDPMQPYSTYTYEDVFKVENNNPGGSDREIDITSISFNPVLPTGVTMSLTVGGTALADIPNIAPGGSVLVDISVTLGSNTTAQGLQTIGIVINGTEVDATP